MTMTVRKQIEEDGTPVMVIRVVGQTSVENMKQLTARALNTWDQAPPEVKEFGDMVTCGQPLQDYYAQNGEPK